MALILDTVQSKILKTNLHCRFSNYLPFL